MDSTFDHPFRQGAPKEAPKPLVYAYSIPKALVDPDAAKIIHRLSRYNYRTYLVGGSVRDILLGRRPKDFDVATDAHPEDVRSLFRNCRIIGRRFRLAHVLFSEGKVVEVATFRKDPSQHFRTLPPRIAQNYTLCSEEGASRIVPEATPEAYEQSADLLIRNDNQFGEPFEDALRRDFTINGLFYDLERGEIIDYVGGVADLELGILRTIGDPNVRLREDPVRILRGIKFSARLDMGIHHDVYEAMIAHARDLRRAAPARILEEIFRLLRSGAAHRAFYLAWDSGVLGEILPELASYLDDHAPEAEYTWGRLQAIDRAYVEDRLPDDAVSLAALLLAPIQEVLDTDSEPNRAYEEFMTELSLRLMLPRRIRDQIRLMVLSQNRLRRGKIQGISQRAYFRDAAMLYTLDCFARGERVPPWAMDPADMSAASAEPRRRKRRRPRRR